jgi:hypothetical protein
MIDYRYWKQPLLSVGHTRACRLMQAIICLVSLRPSLFAADGLDDYLQACANRGDNPAVIHSLSVTYEVDILEQPEGYDEEVAKRLKNQKDTLLQAVKDHGPGGPHENAFMAERLKKSLETFDEWAPPQIHAQFNKRLKIEALYRWQPDEAHSQYRLTLFRYDKTIEKWEEPIKVIRELKSGGTPKENYVKGMYFDTPIRTATVEQGAFNVGTRDVRQFGRLEGAPADMTTAAFADKSKPGTLDFSPEKMDAYKKNVMNVLGNNRNVRAYLISREEEFEGSTVHVIETTRDEQGTVIPIQRVKIDPSRGYICPLIEIYNQAGQIALKWESSGYFLHKNSGLWFPEKYSYIEYDESGAKPRRSESYRITPDSVAINQKMTDDDFAVVLPPDCVVLDVRRQPHRRYKTIGEKSISLASLTDDLSSLGLMEDTGQPVKLNKPMPFIPNPRRMAWWLLVIGNAFFIIAVLLVIKYIHSSRSHHDSH